MKLNTLKVILNAMLLVFLLSGCEEVKEEPGKDAEIEKFWKLKGYFDSNGNSIYPPPFNPDTIFSYEVNINFLYNDVSKHYEIQGQGPYDMFSGEYKPDGKSLKLLNLNTADQSADSPELAQYDVLFFHALNSVSSYSVNNGELTLYFDNGSKKMVFGLKENQYANAEAFMSADINGMSWKGEKGYTLAIIEYDHHTKSYYLNFGGNGNDFLPDGFRYGLSFMIMQKPHTGIYHFNNDSIRINGPRGVMGICVGTNRNSSVVDTRSINGLVAITTMNRSFLEGYFHFDARQYEGTDRKTNKITNGKFLIPLSGNPLTFKPYKFP